MMTIDVLDGIIREGFSGDATLELRPKWEGRSGHELECRRQRQQ